MLYKRNYDSVLLRCVDRREADRIMEEIHEGSFGTHSSGHTMSRKILRAGLPWRPIASVMPENVSNARSMQIR